RKTTDKRRKVPLCRRQKPGLRKANAVEIHETGDHVASERSINMTKGERFAPEWRTFTDDQTGIAIRQLTNYKGHSHHLYFTNPGWHDGGRRLLFGSDRGNRTNLFSVDLSSGEITQLTDRDQPPPPGETSFLFSSVNPRRDEVYFWHGRDLVALDLGSLEERTLYRAP